MINIDPKIRGASSSSKLKKLSKKDQDKSIKFSTEKKTQGASSGEASANVTDITGMLFLQEIDQYAEDQKNLEEFSKKAFNNLKNLQMDLLEGKIESRHLHNLKDVLTSNKFVLNTPKLAAISDEIKLRIEVEVAKIQTYKV
tara:strand:+ start:4534 stop:4959 length:426 start_codon:yes stop_codon:yes gene_type:complete